MEPSVLPGMGRQIYYLVKQVVEQKKMQVYALVCPVWVGYKTSQVFMDGNRLCHRILADGLHPLQAPNAVRKTILYLPWCPIFFVTHYSGENSEVLISIQLLGP